MPVLNSAGEPIHYYVFGSGATIVLVQYPRTFASTDGESHFAEVEVTPEIVQVVPWRPGFESSAVV